jgi:hypothetical protein
MAKKKAKIIEEAVEVIDTIAEEVSETMDAIEELIDEVIFDIGEELSVINFYVRGLNGMKGKLLSIDDKNNATIQLANGTNVIFKKDNLQKVKL